MVRCCRGIWLAFKKLIVRCLVNRAGMQKNRLLCCRKCNGEKYMCKKEIWQNIFTSQECCCCIMFTQVLLQRGSLRKVSLINASLFLPTSILYGQNERLSSVKYLLGLFNNLLDLCKRYYARIDEKQNFIAHFTNFVCLYSCRLTRTQFSLYQRTSYLGILSKNSISVFFFAN